MKTNSMQENVDCIAVLSLTTELPRLSVPLCGRLNNKLNSRYIENLLRFTRERTYMFVCILFSSFRGCNVGIKSLYIQHIRTYLQKYVAFLIIFFSLSVVVYDFDTRDKIKSKLYTHIYNKCY